MLCYWDAAGLDGPRVTGWILASIDRIVKIFISRVEVKSPFDPGFNQQEFGGIIIFHRRSATPLKL